MAEEIVRDNAMIQTHDMLLTPTCVSNEEGQINKQCNHTEQAILTAPQNTRIREVLGSSFGRETGYHTRSRGFLNNSEAVPRRDGYHFRSKLSNSPLGAMQSRH
jgi:hypothetical protein